MQNLSSNELLWLAVLGGVLVVLLFWRNNKSKKDTLSTNHMPSSSLATSKNSKPRLQSSAEEMYEKAVQLYYDDEYSEAMPLFLDAAEQGYALAQFKLGKIYEYGEGVEVDEKQAFMWYKKAAEANNTEAQNYLALLYSGGFCVEQDEKAALYWYERAAENGDDEAKYNAGILYADKKRNTEANALFLELAEKGHAPAQGALGDTYYAGDGVAIDFEQAFMWYKKSAESGYEYACYKLAKLYHKGEGVKQDMETAIYWYEKSAEDKYSKAPEALAKLYEDGDGVEVDAEKAAFWRQRVEELKSDEDDE